jgi:(1->4)-alpha-D-glucan 1-alpha-D-glucosylmutase
MLAELHAGLSVAEILRRSESGMPKLWVTQTALYLRRAHPEWFDGGVDYTPLLAEGPKSEHIIGYLRGKFVATFVPRWTLKLGNWSNTGVMLPAGQWTNLLTGEAIAGGRVRAQLLFKSFPVALLTRTAGDSDEEL